MTQQGVSWSLAVTEGIDEEGTGGQAKVLDVSRVWGGAGPFPLFVTLAVAASGSLVQ